MGVRVQGIQRYLSAILDVDWLLQRELLKMSGGVARLIRIRLIRILIIRT